MVCNYRQNMETLLTMDLSEICVVEKDERCLITVEIDSNTSFEEKVEMITAKTEEYQLGRLHDASYGSMIAVDSLKNGDFDDYSKLFIEIPFLRQRQGLVLSGFSYEMGINENVIERMDDYIVQIEIPLED